LFAATGCCSCPLQSAQGNYQQDRNSNTDQEAQFARCQCLNVIIHNDPVQICYDPLMIRGKDSWCTDEDNEQYDERRTADTDK
jgi:hypothetical protein